MTEYKEENDNKTNADGKKPLPMIGGFYNNVDSEIESEKLERRRYAKYDLFKMISDLESEIQKGGDNDENETSLNDEESMENIKKIILKELENLKKNKSEQLGGVGCGCDASSNTNKKINTKFNLNNVVVDDDTNNLVGGNVIVVDDSSSTSSSTSSSSSDEAGKKKRFKSKPKNNKREEDDSDEDLNIDDDDESSKFFVEDESLSEFGTSNGSVKKSSNKKSKKSKTSKKSNKSKTSKTMKRTNLKNSETEEGISIFPFNSSDIKSSASIGGYRNIRRKI